MSYAFHDIKHIVQPYLDDLPAHSAKHHDYPDHLREIFLCCRHYIIRLNPHKCVLCVESGRLLGFVVSKEGIWIDPLKVELIVNLPPPSSLHQLQSLQRKANFLLCFVPNYVELTNGFTCLLKKGIPFIWDEISQKYFDALKQTLINAPLLHHPDYHRNYFLYLVTIDNIIAMVLVQNDDDDNEHVVYYLSRNLIDTETQYAHVEKLALAAVHVVQWFHHYILIGKTTMISNCNPMTYILTCQFLVGKYSKWIFIV